MRGMRPLLSRKTVAPPAPCRANVASLALGRLCLSRGRREDLLISERAAELYRGEKERTLALGQVDIARAKGTDEGPPPYLHVAVGRSQAAVDERGSSLIRPGPPPCQRCRSAGLEAIHGFALRPGSWSGEDVFLRTRSNRGHGREQAIPRLSSSPRSDERSSRRPKATNGIHTRRSPADTDLTLYLCPARGESRRAV